ncbi:2983_t:CDS:2 [Entrophospora sp. SA101]|nr:909_t:CDS:2 [Entrophospora sp. SA101]CAJ0638920.1 3700_t:CDS:2 [Entrophospora sp. SA101]CAJ0756721.1 2983_t:CDS:2 [Entrophospora sp. SA101]CAJ0826254.1 17067_t:CDS:2 [Entrophospora sp. SA101]CAJ0860308.1 7458_t:CDS:2 [Entrophospora sp. SA101]
MKNQIFPRKFEIATANVSVIINTYLNGFCKNKRKFTKKNIITTTTTCSNQFQRSSLLLYCNLTTNKGHYNIPNVNINNNRLKYYYSSESFKKETKEDDYYESIFKKKNSNLTPFEIFNLPKNANDAEIKKRYFELVKKYHPDSSKDNSTESLDKTYKDKSHIKAYEHLANSKKNSLQNAKRIKTEVMLDSIFLNSENVNDKNNNNICNSSTISSL